jgi:enoyl-CoA hydratase
LTPKSTVSTSRSSDADSAGYEFLRWEQDGAVATVWMNRPPVNAVNQMMYREIRRLFSQPEQLGEGVSVIVLAGEGRHFCGGNDLNEFRTLTPQNSPERMREVREAFWSIYDCSLPVIAAVQGTAVGTGLAIAASCDIVVAAKGARLGVTEINVGVMGAAKHLSRLVPQQLVRSMFYTGEPLAAEDLIGYGAVIAVVPLDELLPEAHRRAALIARHSSVAIRYAKRSLNAIEYDDLKHGYEFEQSLTGELSGHEDSKEAIEAFFERRPPVYRGR